MPTLQDLSNEVLLQILPHCPLKSLIAVHAVSTLWRQLITVAEISPARRGLFDLYFRIVKSRAFHVTRPWLLDNLRPFDRQAYIDALLEQHDYLPEDFRTWILEWPAKAAIAGCWPGLPAKYYRDGDVQPECGLLFQGCNWLGRFPPVIHTVLFSQIEEKELQDVPALLVWEHEDMTWLVLREKPICSHAVYCLPSAQYNGDEELLSDDEEDWTQGDYNRGTEAAFVCSSWTYWLTSTFETMEDKLIFEELNQPDPEVCVTRAQTGDEWFRDQPRMDPRLWIERR